ncbi:MAG: hypothetical protein GY856_45490 [bacterium]|nr:hypothetical protein [bacterium]
MTRLAGAVGRSRHQTVVETARELLILDPTETLVWSYLADSAEALGMDEESLRCRHRILELKPDDFRTLERLVRMHLRRGEESAAYAYLKRALAAAPAEGVKAPRSALAVLGLLGFLTGRLGLVKRTRSREGRYDQWLMEWKQWAQAAIDSWEER